MEIKMIQKATKKTKLTKKGQIHFNQIQCTNIKSKQNQFIHLPKFEINKSHLLTNRKSLFQDWTEPINKYNKKHKESFYLTSKQAFRQSSLTFGKQIPKETQYSCLLTQKDVSRCKKQNSKLKLLLKQRRTNLSDTLRASGHKMHKSYLNCYQQSIKQQFLEQKQQLKFNPTKSQMNMDVNMGVSKTCILIKPPNFINKSNNDGDIFIKEQNLFNIQLENKICYDMIFPIFRNGATLTNANKHIYLAGGVNNQLTQRYSLYRFSNQNKIWQSVQNKHNFCPSYHTAETIGNNIIFIGGISQNLSLKALIPDITIYDTQTLEWSKIRWHKKLQCHASTIYGNMLVVHGGINQREQYLSQLYFLPLSMPKISQTKVMPFNLIAHCEGIAHHKIITTFQIQASLQPKLLVDGILCYGGLYSSQQINKDLLLYRFNKNKQGNIQLAVKQWQVITTHGLKPQPRYNHSMNVINRKGVVFVCGGMGQSKKVLNDAWVFNLLNLNWIKALFDKDYSILERGVHEHITTIVQNQIFIFGGMDATLKYANQFWSIDFMFDRTVKQQTRRRPKEGSRHKIIERFSIQI